MPVDDGRRPVSRLDRDGLQSGAWQWALVNRVPRLARRSMFGVLACGWPPRQPTQSFWSSMATNRTFGLSAARDAGERSCASAPRASRTMATVWRVTAVAPGGEIVLAPEGRKPVAHDVSR